MNTVTRIGGLGVTLALLAAGPVSAQVRDGSRDTVPPYTVAPQLENSAEIARMLESRYPPDLRDRGITGTVLLIVQIDTQGQVRRSTVWESSGYDEFDEVAKSVAASMRFVPARSTTGPISVRIEVPVTFTLKQNAPAAPEFIAYDVKPALLNATEANRVLEVLYPARLQQAKIGGRTVLWVYVGADGYPAQVRVMESSGYEEFDRAAGLASRVMEFRPAQADGAPVAVWNPVTVTFLPEGGSTIRP